ncbi:hypothetical protein AYK24_00490 [Thermoplasmatales archaeon SG8-52-4]|nr:MAG: hypothetical protein AYK24_00490 [Thermoplasmatales archaeon SG8-52-4]
MKRIIAMVGTSPMFGMVQEIPSLEKLEIELLPIDPMPSQEELDIIEKNVGLQIQIIRYPHTIKSSLIGAIIDVTDSPKNPIE